MENYIMRKITFITLMMILGMSSVSFGKSYFCLPTSGTTFLDDNFHIRNINKDKLKGIDDKWLVKTEGNDRKMISVKFFGEDWYLCKVGEKYIDGGKVWSGVGESIKGGDFLSCRQPHTSLNGGFTKNEFNLNFKTKVFYYYSMSSLGRIGEVTFGRCEEI